jgi:APA family basic amino acid/polyamine antiporter
MGILLAFTGVCIGVLVLRYTKPDLKRPFRVPVVHVTCILGAVICGGITYFLPHETWLLFLIWSVIGFSIYAFYGYATAACGPKADSRGLKGREGPRWCGGQVFT